MDYEPNLSEGIAKAGAAAKAVVYEFTILTNDDWAITLLTDEPVDHVLGMVTFRSVIVQPLEAFNARVVADTVVSSSTSLKKTLLLDENQWL